MKKIATLLSLFWEFFRISLFVIGGGYSILVVADSVFSRKGWIREDELVEHLPVFQMVPGLIAAHTAVFVGNRVAGMLGASVAVFAVALPSIAVFTAATIWYRELPLDNPWLSSAFVGLRSALAGIIAATFFRSWRKFMGDAFSYAVFIAGVLALSVAHVPVVAVLSASVLCGVLYSRTRCDRIKVRSAFWLPILCFLKYGLLCFGGGFVLVPMYIEDFVGPAAPYLNLPEVDFSNVMALSQMTPGPIGVNCATFFGYRIAGVGGAILASVCLLIPGSVLVFAVLRSLDRFRTSAFVQGVMRGIRPASLAMIGVALLVFLRMAVVAHDKSFNTTAIILVIITIFMTIRKKINVILLIVLCAAAACAVRADEVTVERFPDSDAVVVDERERVEYAADGTSVTSSESWTKILTERGRRNESVLTMEYNARYSKLRVAYVGAVDTNGVERAIDVSATTNESTENGSLSVNIVDPMDRKIVCSIPGLRVGETVHVRIERETFKSRFRNQWCDMTLLEWSHPILRSVYEVKAPAARPVRSRKVCHPIGNVSERIEPQPDGSTIYTYTATNSPRMFPEPDMPPVWTQVQSVRLSTVSDWRDVSKWYWELCESHLAKTTEAISNKVAAIGNDVSKIFKFVSQEIRYMGLTMEDVSPGYAPHDVNITFDNRYGVCRDKAGLLVAMLRVAGFEAYPVLINVGAKMDPDVPEIYFNHAIVAVVEKDGTYRLMDPTNENAKDLFPAYLGNCSYIVARPDGDVLRTSPVRPSAANSVTVNTKGRLDRDGNILMDSDVRFFGINDVAFRGALARMKPSEREKFFERRIRSVRPGGELLRLKIEPDDLQDTDVPLSVSMLSKLPESVVRGETGDVLDMPFMSKVLSVASLVLAGNTSLDERRYPLVLDSTAGMDETVTLELGDALGDVKSLPPTVSFSDGYAYLRTFAVSNGMLTARRRLSIDSVEISPGDYVKIRENLKCVEAAERVKCVFESRGCVGANLRWIVDSAEIDMKSERAWTVSNSYVKEVLTYAGKKRAAELKFYGNPLWKNVRIVSATVSNLNGMVQHVKPDEINEMDASWKASAPRYPASRSLIVSLPSVEIGSVISVVTETQVTDSPAPFRGEWFFDSCEPLDRRYLRLNGLVRDERSPKRLPDEPNQPPSWMWRDGIAVSSNCFSSVAGELRRAVDVAPLELEDCHDVESTRNWMARNVRLAGPSLYEVPISAQLTDPEVVVSERYATRLDYMRTMASLLRGAGFDVDIVFAANDANDSSASRERLMRDCPDVTAFCMPLCRVRTSVGGFFGFGADERTFYLGYENERTPIGATDFNGCDFFDPVTESFGVVCAQEGYRDCVKEKIDIGVRDNGAVDYDREVLLYGAAVGDFRRRYAEILPEDFSRHHQELLGEVAKSATATSELHADVDSYPARLAFSCFVPGYATVDGDVLSLVMPGLINPFPSLGGGIRTTPFILRGDDDAVQTVTVRFPEGYVGVEHLPKSLELRDPADPDAVLLRDDVASVVEDGRLVVTVRRTICARRDRIYEPQYADLFREWSRICQSSVRRTVSARREHRSPR